MSSKDQSMEVSGNVEEHEHSSIYPDFEDHKEDSMLQFNFDERVVNELGLRADDNYQFRDVDEILTERSRRFYDPKLTDKNKERCIVVGVDTKLSERRGLKEAEISFSFDESLYELCELCGTAGLAVIGSCFQRMYKPNFGTYIGPGKVIELMAALNATGVRTVVIDDDLTTKQQRTLERTLDSMGGGDVKIIDRTALILEIFAQHAKSKEGQLQVELAMCEYRLTRGPSPEILANDRGSGSVGMRGPGETKLETDKRVIRERIIMLKKQIEALTSKREHSRDSRKRLGLPVVALVGYTNAGKSTLLNKLSRAGVLAENMLFATLDPTTRRVRIPRSRKGNINVEEEEEETKQRYNKGQEVLLTDTVGFISKLPTDLIAAFRATLEEVCCADVLIHVCDRSSPVWKKQRETVLRELEAIGCIHTPIVELWNKIDVVDDPNNVMLEAMTLPIDVDMVQRDNNIDDVTTVTESNDDWEQYDNGEWDGNEGYIRATTQHEANQGDKDPTNLNLKRKDIAANRLRAEVASRAQLYGEFPYGPRKRKVFTVAASVKTDLGFDDFTSTLEDALSLLLKQIEVFIPFSQDNGMIAMIHNQGYVFDTSYTDIGTRISCRVPDSLYNKLKSFQIYVDEGEFV